MLTLTYQLRFSKRQSLHRPLLCLTLSNKNCRPFRPVHFASGFRPSITGLSNSAINQVQVPSSTHVSGPVPGHLSHNIVLEPAYFGSAGGKNNTSVVYAVEAQQAQQPGPDISALDSVLQQQWDHAANADLGQKAITKFCNVQVWWICDQCPEGCLHRWLAVVNNRSRGAGCPYCTNRKLCKHNSLATIAPKVAAYWDSQLNGCLPEEVIAGSPRQAHWLCPDCKHRWTAHTKARVRHGSGCPKCAIRLRQGHPRHSTFADAQHPLLAEWDTKRNAAEDVYPDQITLGSSQKVHWICGRCALGQEHRWRATPNNRLSKFASGCPFCAGQAACRCNSLQTLCPDIASEWHPAKNIPNTPSDYTEGSGVVVWWHNEARGTWQQRIKERCHNFHRARKSQQQVGL